VIIWFSSVKLFKINNLPIYSDLKNIKKLMSS
jgi:hypothetical protein